MYWETFVEQNGGVQLYNSMKLVTLVDRAVKSTGVGCHNAAEQDVTNSTFGILHTAQFALQ